VKSGPDKKLITVLLATTHFLFVQLCILPLLTLAVPKPLGPHMDFGGLWGNYICIPEPPTTWWMTSEEVYQHLICSAQADMHLLEATRQQQPTTHCTVYTDHHLLLIPIPLKPHFKGRHLKKEVEEHLLSCCTPRRSKQRRKDGGNEY